MNLSASSDELAFVPTVVDARAPVRLSGEPGLGTVIAGRYRLDAVVGRGASGTVFRAADLERGADVALKVLRAELAADPKWVARFGRELALVKPIQHPNVCRVFDGGEAGGVHFITMELATAGSLRREIAAPRPAPLGRRISDARQLCAGVAAIHDAGFVHRDLKPENVLRMADGRLVVSDFGLATPPDRTTVTVLIGTPGYMAPEVRAGERASAASDVWALGVTVHELVLGMRPDEVEAGGGSAASGSRAGGSKLEAAVADFCAQCTEPDPARRPANGAAALARLDEAIRRGRPRLAAAPLAFLRRRRRLARGAAGVLVGAAAVIVLARFAFVPVSVASSARRAPKLELREEAPVASARTLARMTGHVRCLEPLGSGRVRAIMDAPASATDISLATGAMVPAVLAPETFATGCPRLSPDGSRLAFERSASPGHPEIALALADGSNAERLWDGGDPVWLPDGSGLVIDVDATHVALFSLDSRQPAILPTPPGFGQELRGKAVAPDGGSIAFTWMGADLPGTVGLLTLPASGPPQIWSTAGPVGAPSFSPDGAFRLTLVDAAGHFALVERRGDGLVPLIADSDADIGAVARVDGRTMLVAQQRRSDVVLVGADGDETVLTRDGRSWQPTASPRGDVLFSRPDDEGRSRVVLLSRGGVERFVSEGPVDITPSFSPAGGMFVFARHAGNDRSVMVCGADGAGCRRLTSDPQLWSKPTLASSGHLAYVTSGQRLRIVRAGETRPIDAGPAPVDCPPRWTEAGRLAVARGPAEARVWIELDARSGKEAARGGPVGPECRHPDDRPGPRAFGRISIASEVRLADM